MSDDIPFDIQREIITRVSNVKSLIRFRSVSKTWKSFIDSPKFIDGYGARHTQPHSHILSLLFGSEERLMCLVDDDVETFKVLQQEFAPFVMSPLLKQYRVLYFIGACHGLLCLFCCYKKYYFKKMVVIWNPSIGKSFGIALPRFYPMNQAYTQNLLDFGFGVFPNIQTEFGFGVCPVTSDPTVVKVSCAVNMPWHVEVFTLSSGVWNVIPIGNLPRQSITINNSTQVVIDRFIYWGAYELTFTNNGKSTINHMVVSFDLITKEFKVVDLPNNLTNELISDVSVSKLRGSLLVYGSIYVDTAECSSVWVMEHDSSFRKLFTIGAPVDKILGFKKNGETIFETQKADEQFTTLNVYDPCSQQIKNLGISGVRGCSFFMSSYKDSLLLLDHSDLRIYSDDSLSK